MYLKISKVLVACVFAFSLVLVCSVAMAASQSAKIVGTKVNIRTSPNTSAGIVTKLSNSSVSIIDKVDGWYKISFNGKTGWVSSDYIKVLSKKATINADGVNFRSSANTDAKVIDTLSKGTRVEILDTKSGWHKVKVGSKVGYVASKFVTSAKSSVKTSRSITAEAFDASDDSQGNDVTSYAKRYVGVRYVYGGKSPNGFDCSGFVGYVYRHFGVSLNSSAESMFSNGVRVSKSGLRAGDLLFFDAAARKSAGEIDHVGIYLGGDKFIHASTSNGRVLIQSLSGYHGTYIGAKRVM
jgi:cell wall-associated NlpC family hydrolase